MRASFLIRAKFLCLIFITFHIITHHISRPTSRLVGCSTVNVIRPASQNRSDTDHAGGGRVAHNTPLDRSPSSPRPEPNSSTTVKSNKNETNSNVSKKQAETDDQIFASIYWPKFNSSSNELDVRDYLSVQKIETNEGWLSASDHFTGSAPSTIDADEAGTANGNANGNGSSSSSEAEPSYDDGGQVFPIEFLEPDESVEPPISQCINSSDVDLPPKFVRIGFTALYAFILPFGLFGNLLTLYVMLRKKTSISILDIFIANLAISDILLCAFSVPTAPINSLHYGYWVFGRTFCFIYSFTMSSSVYSSTLTMIFIGFYRYQLIVNAHKNNMTKQHAYACCCFTWLLGILVATPFTANVDIEPDGCEVSFCGENWQLPMSRFRFSMATLVVQFFVPLVSTSYFYSSIYFTLSKQEKVKYSWNREIGDKAKTLVTNSTSAHQFQQIALTPAPLQAKRLNRFGQLFAARERNSESAIKCPASQTNHCDSRQPPREPTKVSELKRHLYRLRAKSPLAKSRSGNSGSQITPNTPSAMLNSNAASSPTIVDSVNQSLGAESTSDLAPTQSSVKVTIIENEGERACCRVDALSGGGQSVRYAEPTKAASEADCEQELSELTNMPTNETPEPNNILFVDTVSLEVGAERSARFPSQQSVSQHQLKRATSDLTTRRLSLLQQMPPTLGVCSSAGSTSHLARYKRHNGDQAMRRLLPEFRFNREEQLRQRNRRIQQTNKKLLAVIGLFVISWLPLNIYNSVMDFMEIEQESIETRLLFILAQTCASVSVCYNPLLYAWMSENYRQELANVLPASLRLLLRIQSPSEIP